MSTRYWLSVCGFSWGFSSFWDGLSSDEFGLSSDVGTTTAGGSDCFDSSDAGAAGTTTGFDCLCDGDGAESLLTGGELFSGEREASRDERISLSFSTSGNGGEASGEGEAGSRFSV
jgi:hypothetical protein